MLSDKALKILFACKDVIVKETGVEFGRTSEVMVEGLNQSQIKGYLSTLQGRGMITTFDNGNHNNVKLTVLGCDTLLERATNATEIEQILDIKNNI